MASRAWGALDERGVYAHAIANFYLLSVTGLKEAGSDNKLEKTVTLGRRMLLTG